MKVLLTRSQPMNETTASVLAADGHEGIECPLVEYVDTGVVVPDGDIGGVIFTSQAALQILKEREIEGQLVSRALDVFAVGEKTEKRARELGFTKIATGGGGAEDLVELIHQRLIKKPLLYLAGIDRSFEFSAVDAVTIEIYEARLIDPGKDRLQRALAEISNCCAFLYSVRTATHLLDLISHHKLEKTIENVTFIAISKAVAEAVASKVKLPVQISAEPNQSAMIELLGNLEKNGKFR